MVSPLISRASESESTISLAPILVSGSDSFQTIGENLDDSAFLLPGSSMKIWQRTRYGQRFFDLNGENSLARMGRGGFFSLAADAENYLNSSPRLFLRAGEMQSAKLEARALKWGPGKLALSIHAQNDQRKRRFLDPNGTPFQANDDFLRNQRLQQKSLGSGAEYSLGAWQAALDFDFDERGQWAGSREVGARRERVVDAGIFYKQRQWQLSGTSAWEGRNFRSLDQSLPSSERDRVSNSARAAYQWMIGQFSAFSLNREEIRSRDSLTRTRRFQRLEAELAHVGRFNANWAELTLSGAYLLQMDEASAARPEQNNQLWRGKAEISTAPRLRLGWQGGLERVVKPAPIAAVFGDGALIDANPELPVEEGVLLSTGPWIKGESFRWSLLGFWEESRDVAVPFGSSAVRARYLPIGATWARGWKLEGIQEFWAAITATVSLGRQEAINASLVPSERGRPLPGRPLGFASNSLEWRRQRWRLILGHEYRSTQYSDLSGRVSLPAQHRFNLRAIYEKPRSWLLALEINNVNAPKPDPLGFAGLAGARLLAPQFSEREIFLRWEKQL